MLGGEGSGGVICVVQDVAQAACLDQGQGTYGQAFDSFLLAGRGILIGLVRSKAGSRYPVTNPWRNDEIRPGDAGVLLSLPWQGGAEGSQWEKGSGVGIVWGVGGQVGQLVVRGFAAGGDAEGAGVRVGDVLMGVGDAPALPSGVGPMDEAGLIKSLRGKHGSEVRCHVPLETGHQQKLGFRCADTRPYILVSRRLGTHSSIQTVWHRNMAGPMFRLSSSNSASKP
jgi:hypothetical protein